MESVHEAMLAEQRAAQLVDSIINLGGNAMQFAQVERQTAGSDGRPESDTDHTVMLGLIAVALAEYDPRLDRGKVALYSLVHDWPEVYAGDVPTLHQNKVDFEAKQLAERKAVERLDAQFGTPFPGLISILKSYEDQDDLESTFVRTLDKSMPAITHMFNDCVAVLNEFDSATQVRENSRRHSEKLANSYGAEHPIVIALRKLISARFADLFEKRKLESA